MWQSVQSTVSNTLQGVKSMVNTVSDLPRAMNSVFSHGSTPMHKAAAEGQLDVLKKLVDEGKSPHERNKLGLTPLHFAALFGHLNVVRYLVDLVDEKKVSFNEKDIMGLTYGLSILSYEEQLLQLEINQPLHWLNQP